MPFINMRRFSQRCPALLATFFARDTKVNRKPVQVVDVLHSADSASLDQTPVQCAAEGVDLVSVCNQEILAKEWGTCYKREFFTGRGPTSR